MIVEPWRHWNVFKQIFADHWDVFKETRPRYNTRYYDGLVQKMLGCGDPDKMGYIEYRCQHCGEGQHWVSMTCKSSLCLRCAKVYVDDWVTQGMSEDWVRHEVAAIIVVRRTIGDTTRCPISGILRRCAGR